ncbi:MAG: hypothetical protein RLZZ387_441 [Chloroflexota bacterium]
MQDTVLSPCAPSASGEEVAPVRATTLPIVVPCDDAAIAPLDVLDLAVLICERPATAAALLGALTPAQRHAQAIAHASWLSQRGLVTAPATLLRAWDALLRQHLHRPHRRHTRPPAPRRPRPTPPTSPGTASGPARWRCS